MLIVGLTGGIASGKSVVGAELARLGCRVVEADQLGREVMEPGGTAFRPVVETFGPQILNEDGGINRSRLAAIVFNDPDQLEVLNSIVHPAVHDLAEQRFAEIAGQDADAIIVYAAAILVETGAYQEFPKLIVVACSRENQIERALQRPGATEADVLARIDRQLPLKFKLEFADYVIGTDGTLAETLRQTRMVYESLLALSRRTLPGYKA
jgi:dephospho-CoA kinase